MILTPVIAIQIVVGTLLVQRYFYDVIEQLDNLVIKDITVAKSISKNNADFFNILHRLNIKHSNEPVLEGNHYGWVDISGRLMRSNFAKSFGEPVFISTSEDTKVRITLASHDPVLNLEFTKNMLAPINPHQIMLNLFGFSMLLSLISLGFLRNQVRSLRNLSRAAKAFGRGEMIAYNPSGGDEIRSAGLSFLAMRKRILRQREQRNLLLSGVSHDLRTPLTRMKLSVAMLENEDDKKTLNDDIQSIEALADSFLSYAANDIVEAFEDRNLYEFIFEIARHFKNVQMHGDQILTGRIRPILFGRGIENLISNANRYASHIVITITSYARFTEILIDDNGPGIAPELREDAMKAFTRLDPSRNCDKGGNVGLGLAIAADAIRLHGGEITLDDSPQKGLRVKISLPQKITDI